MSTCARRCPRRARTSCARSSGPGGRAVRPRSRRACWASTAACGPSGAGRPPPPGEVGTITCAPGPGSFVLDLSVRGERRTLTNRRTITNRYVLTAGPGFADLLTLPEARVTTELETGDTTWTLRLRHEAGPVVPFVRLLDARPAAAPGWARWDDNAFDLLPGEERVLHATWDGVPPQDRRIRLDAWNLPPTTLTDAGA
ncbi:glycoside hydrolase family 2 protein [Nonomuraea salmonea]|uniref:glycoside hydrolase family 2 protein n=1 Tax=Nonomuraea salmonea TaxID=46181 RepID=UPI003CD0B146